MINAPVSQKDKWVSCRKENDDISINFLAERYPDDIVVNDINISINFLAERHLERRVRQRLWL